MPPRNDRLLQTATAAIDAGNSASIDALRSCVIALCHNRVVPQSQLDVLVFHETQQVGLKNDKETAVGKPPTHTIPPWVTRGPPGQPT